MSITPVFTAFLRTGKLEDGADEVDETQNYRGVGKTNGLQPNQGSKEGSHIICTKNKREKDRTRAREPKSGDFLDASMEKIRRLAKEKKQSGTKNQGKSQNAYMNWGGGRKYTLSSRSQTVSYSAKL